MQKIIADLLRNIEKEQNIKILFAVENGSRVWGMESQNSDYDVRFVYIRQLKEYISLFQPADVLTYAYDKDLKPHEVKGSLVDMSGFDLFKYLKLLASSNPTTIEWLFSPILYLGSNRNELQRHMTENFSREKLYYHYFSLFQNNYLQYIAAEKRLTHKKYLYSMRGLLNAEYVLLFDKIPPLRIMETIGELEDYLPPEVTAELRKIIALKSRGEEKEAIARIPLLDNYMETERAKAAPKFAKKSTDCQIFDGFLRRCLGIDF